MRLGASISWIFIFCCFTYSVQAQYVTINSGAWNNPGTWNLGSVPTSASGTITVNHIVNIPSGYSVSVDEVTVNSQIIITSGGVLTLANGTGNDLTMNAGSSLLINGELIRNDLTTINQVGSLNFGAGSFYRHRYTTTEGIPPTASWDPASNFSLEGFTNTVTLDLTSTAWNQNFGNFIYNCTGQKGAVNLNGLITSVQGNFTFQSTGTNITKLTDSENNAVLAVGGNFLISGTSKVNFSETGAGSTLTVNGNFGFTSSNTGGSFFTTTGNFIVNILGDFTMTAGAGRLYFASSAGSTGTSAINLSKNFNLVSGILSETGSGTANGNINFTGNGAFTFTNTGTISGVINYHINSTVTLDLGASPMSGGGSFLLDGTVVCGSLEPTGAIRNSTGLGNIRTTTTLRTYSPGSTIIYRSTSFQIIGDGQPSAAGITTIIDNTANVSLYQGSAAVLTYNGLLSLQNGILFIGTRTLNLNGTIIYGSGLLGGSSSSVLNIGGTSGGNFGNLTFAPANNQLNTLTVNRTGNGAEVNVNATLTIAAKLNLTSGILRNISGLTAGNDCLVTRYATSQLLANGLAYATGEFYDVLYKTAVHASFTTGLELPGVADASGLRNVTVTPALTTDSLSLSKDVFMNGSITFNKGLVLSNNHAITLKGDWVDGSGNFDTGTGTVIFDGISSITGTSNTTFYNLQVNPGKTLTDARSFNVKGNIDFKATSTFDPGLFTLTLNGSTLQTISGNGSSLFNVIVAKSAGNVQLTSGVNMINLLRFNTPSANCNFQSNGFLTLVSTTDAVGTATAPGTAQIYRLASGNTVTGDVIVQRYMSGEGRIYRYLSSSVTNATVASWKDDFPITGLFSDPSASTVICGSSINKKNPSLFYYDETALGNADAGYVAYPKTGLASANPLVVGKGYTAFIRECTNPTIVDVTGPINQGTITIPVTYTNTGDASADGYNLVGNPYPCTIDWDLGLTKTRISSVVSIRDNGTGMMLYWDGSTGTVPSGQIAPGQAFWIRATAANPIFKISENSKNITPAQTGEFFREAAPNRLTLALSDGKLIDKAFIKVRIDSSENSLDDWDAPKLNNDLFDVYTLSSDSLPMAINSLKSFDCSKPLLVGIKDMEKGTYSLSIAELQGQFTSFRYTLIDSYTGQQFDLSKAYIFSVDDNPLSSEKYRFIIDASPLVQPVISVENGATLSVNYTTGVQWFLNENVLPGETNSTIEAVQSGVYAAHIQNEGCEIIASYDFLVTGNEGEVSNAFSMYPNPVVRFLYLKYDREKISIDNISIIDNLGKQKSINMQETSEGVWIDLEDYTKGIYYLTFYKDGRLNNFKLLKN